MDDALTVRTLPGEENGSCSKHIDSDEFENFSHLENSVTDSTCSLKLTISSLNGEIRIILS